MEVSQEDMIKAAESLAFSKESAEETVRFIDRLTDGELVSLSETLQGREGAK